MNPKLLFGYVLLVAHECAALKILIYQVAYSGTHMPYSGAIADTLIDRGHVVDQIVMVYNPAVKTNGSTRFRNIYRLEIEDEKNPFLNGGHLTDPFKFRYFSRHDQAFVRSRQLFCKQLGDDKNLMNTLKAENYDVLMVSPFDVCIIGLNQLLRIPSLNVYSVLGQDGYFSWKLGTPMPPSYVSQIYESRVNNKRKNFLERLWSFLYLTNYELDEEGGSVGELQYLRSRVPNLPSITQMLKGISYVFLNTNEIIDISVPTSSRIKYLAGIVKPKEEKELPQKIKQILSTSNQSTIVLSFGSLIQTSLIPLRIKMEIMRAFQQFPSYTFIWKLHSEDEIRPYLKNATNIHALSWLPQISLLNDPNVKLFISHLGMNSYLETSFAGKPFVAIPFFVDQFYNTEALLHNEVGVYLDKQKISAESLASALKQVLENEKYARNAKDISQLLKQRPQDVREELIRYVEYSAKNPRLPEFLNLEAADLPVWKLYSLDVIAFLLLSAVLLTFLVVFVLSHLMTMTKNSKSKQE